MRLLMVDDNPADIELLRIALDGIGRPYEMTTAQDGHDALAVLERSSVAHQLPAIIVLDLNMPKMRGQEFLGRLRSHAVLSGIPVLVLTSSQAAHDRAECLALGAKDYLRKPSTLSELIAIANQILDAGGGGSPPGPRGPSDPRPPEDTPPPKAVSAWLSSAVRRVPRLMDVLYVRPAPLNDEGLATSVSVASPFRSWRDRRCVVPPVSRSPLRRNAALGTSWTCSGSVRAVRSRWSSRS